MPVVARIPSCTPIRDVLIHADFIRRIGFFLSNDQDWSFRFHHIPLLSRFYWGMQRPARAWTESSWPTSEASGSQREQREQSRQAREHDLADFHSGLHDRGEVWWSDDSDWPDSDDGLSDLPATTLEAGEIRDPSE